MTLHGHIKGQKGKSSQYFFTFHIFLILQNHSQCIMKEIRIFRFFFNLNFEKKIIPVFFLYLKLATNDWFTSLPCVPHTQHTPAWVVATPQTHFQD